MCYDAGANQLVIPMNANNGLAFSAIGFADRVAVIHRAGKIGVRKRDPTVRSIAQNVTRRRLAIHARRKSPAADSRTRGPSD
jgi:hypothetical protein